LSDKALFAADAHGFVHSGQRYLVASTTAIKPIVFDDTKQGSTRLYFLLYEEKPDGKLCIFSVLMQHLPRKSRKDSPGTLHREGQPVFKK